MEKNPWEILEAIVYTKIQIHQDYTKIIPFDFKFHHTNLEIHQQIGCIFYATTVATKGLVLDKTPLKARTNFPGVQASCKDLRVEDLNSEDFPQRQPERSEEKHWKGWKRYGMYGKVLMIIFDLNLFYLKRLS